MRSLEEEARFLRLALVDIVMREDFDAFKAVMMTNRMARIVSSTVDEVTGQVTEPTDAALHRRMITLKRLFVHRNRQN
jgi:hypothetical protein